MVIRSEALKRVIPSVSEGPGGTGGMLHISGKATTEDTEVTEILRELTSVCLCEPCALCGYGRPASPWYLSIVNIRRPERLRSLQQADELTRVVDEHRQVLRAYMDVPPLVYQRDEGDDFRIALTEKTDRLAHETDDGAGPRSQV